MKYVVQVITSRGELLYCSRGLPLHAAIVVRAECNDIVRGMSDSNSDLLPAFLTMADRQEHDGLDRARP